LLLCRSDNDKAPRLQVVGARGAQPGIKNAAEVSEGNRTSVKAWGCAAIVNCPRQRFFRAHRLLFSVVPELESKRSTCLAGTLLLPKQRSCVTLDTNNSLLYRPWNETPHLLCQPPNELLAQLG